MTRRRIDTIRRIVFIGIIGMIVLAVVFGVLWNRKHTPTISLIKDLPEAMTLGQRYPVVVEVSLPWRMSPSAVNTAITGDVQSVAKTWSVKSFRPGYLIWQCELQLISTETGTERQGSLEIVVDGEQTEFQLAATHVKGLLGEGEDFMPPMSEYSPEAHSVPYALWGAIFFGIIAAAGFIIALKPRPKKAEPLTPAERLSKTLMGLGTESDVPTAQLHQRISDEVRMYLHEAWALSATTSSKDQLLAEMASNAGIPDEVKQAVSTYLEAADRAKYAPPGEKVDAADHLNSALELLNASEEHRRGEVLNA